MVLALVPSIRPIEPIQHESRWKKWNRTAHPGSPSATRRPALPIRSRLWIALLGPSLEEGIVGIGYTVESALRAFDTQYMAGQHSPNKPDESRAAGKRAHRLIRSTPRLSLRGRTS
jgi:hypothetical protein